MTRREHLQSTLSYKENEHSHVVKVDDYDIKIINMNEFDEIVLSKILRDSMRRIFSSRVIAWVCFKMVSGNIVNIRQYNYKDYHDLRAVSKKIIEYATENYATTLFIQTEHYSDKKIKDPRAPSWFLQ